MTDPTYRVTFGDGWIKLERESMVMVKSRWLKRIKFEKGWRMIGVYKSDHKHLVYNMAISGLDKMALELRGTQFNFNDAALMS